MRISAKGRYALAAAVYMASKYNNGEYITVISISERLGISKIYLEQVFSLLKRGEIVLSVKGAQGGYQLTRMPQRITVYDVLSSVEISLFEPVEDTVREKAPELDAALRLSAFDTIDQILKKTLTDISLYDLSLEAERQKTNQGFMYYI